MKLDLLVGAQAGPRVVRRLNTVIVFLVLLVVSIPGGVWASHQFSDVPDGHTHHATISAIKNAGITGGCTASTYCPSEPVTRAQMATFFQRGAGRVAMGTLNNPISLPSSGSVVTITQVQLDVPGVQSAGNVQFVKVDAALTTFQTGTGCPCQIIAWLRDATSGTMSQTMTHTLVNPSNEVAQGHNGAATWVFSVPSGTTRTFQLQMFQNQGQSLSLTAKGTITAVTAPFGSTGSNTI